MKINKEHIHDRYKAVVIGGSAGSFQIVTFLLSQLPKDYPLPIIMALHRLKHVRHGFVEALAIKSNLPVSEPYDKEGLKKSRVYLAPANYHMSLELGNTFSLTTEGMVNNSRPAIDITLDTVSYVLKQKLVGILLSGANKDGAYGMKRIADRGGLTIVQDPSTCMIDTMPSSALAISPIDYCLKPEEILEIMLKIGKAQVKV